MIKLLLAAAAIYLAYRLFANDFKKFRAKQMETKKKEDAEKMECGEMRQDPECGTFVAIDDSISVRDGDNLYYFCSYECRDKFLKKLAEARGTLPGDKGSQEHES